MKKLKSYDDLRQERYEHNGRIYSIVDLTIAPLEADGTRYDGHFTELMQEHYGQYKYELADMTEDDIVVISRFTSFKLAREAIENGTITLEWEYS